MDGKICTIDGCRVIPLTKREVKDMKFMCKAYKALKETLIMNYGDDIFDNELVEMLDERVSETCEVYR